MGVFSDLHTQIVFKPPIPITSFAGKTIIVTGANTGLGKEAAKHLVRLGAERVICTARSLSKGEAAKAEIEMETERIGVVDTWMLDYSNYASVKSFAAKAGALARLDIVILNAGVATEQWEVFEDNESTITVNVVSTTLLILLLLPVLRSSATKYDIEPVITVVGSGVHYYTSFPERKTPNSLATLNNKDTAVMTDRYQVSKLLQLFAVREMAEKTAKANPFVIINTVNPGLCYTDLTRSATGATYVVLKVMRWLLAWTAEEGSRTLVHAVTTGPESHGIFISMCKLENNAQSGFVTSADGQQTQKKVWDELCAKLEVIQPGITADL